MVQRACPKGKKTPHHTSSGWASELLLPVVPLSKVMCDNQLTFETRLGFIPRNLVDPASCHMLVSRTKPCKCESTRGLPREVCVRLIKRFIVYPTKDVHLPPQRDNFANCKANTCKKNLVPFKQWGDLRVASLWCEVRFAETKTNAVFRQLILLRQANVAKAPYRRVVGRIYHLSG